MRGRRFFALLLALALALPLSERKEEEKSMFYITVNGQTLSADFADNSSASAFRELLEKGPVTVSMDDYGGFEKVGSLGTTLPRNDNQITTEPGDVILYQGSSITIYYDKNSWSFTRLGKIRDTAQDRLKEVLRAGGGEVSVTFSLVRDAGVAPEDITVYDVSRLFPDYMMELCTAGKLQGVRFVGRDNGVADEKAPILWSHEFSGKVNYLPTCVTGAEYVINLANLKGHSYGITLCGKNHFGSFINGNRMRPPEGANLHQWLTRNEMGLYSPLVDLMANADLGGKTVLYMLDALICAVSEGSTVTAENSRWQQEPFHGHYTASVFVSQDPVAIDSVGADLLMNEPTVTGRNGALRNNPTVENYLHEAALVGEAPSGTVYTDSQGHAVTNLGVHEHWNNSVQKQYSRNLGKAEGIELVRLES